MDHENRMRGDAEFARWYTTHHHRIRSLCARILRDDAAGEDLAQETLLKAWTRRESIREEDVGAWLTVVARNLCISHLRRHGRVVPTDAVPDVADVGADPLATVERLESRRAVRRAMRQIEERQRRALFLHEVNGADYEEIGEEFGLSAEGVRSIAFRARRVLRARLAAVGEGLSAILVGFRVQTRGLRERIRNGATALENGVAQNGINLAFAAAVTVTAVAGSAIQSSGGASLSRESSVGRTEVALVSPSNPGASSTYIDRELRSANGTNEADRRPSLAERAKVDARPYNRGDGSAYYDVNILGTGGTLTFERKPNDGFEWMYGIQDQAFPVACEFANQLCSSDGEENTP